MTKLTFEKSIAFGQRLEQLIPGGAHTYSKGRDQFPVLAPNGIVRGKGALVWDQDGNEFVDWGMGLTSVSIGHAYDPVDDAVCDAIRKGVNFPRPAALELEAAETLLDAVGVDGMVKFAKHGSTVTTAAVKLARAKTGRNLVACPLEQPFFSFDDWFIGTTLVNFGILDRIKETTKRFRYDDIDDLNKLFSTHPDEIACVIMEPIKFAHPRDRYLQEVKELCHSNGALLIFDEMVTGCKWAVGGGQKYFGVRADLSTWGKGIANGYACAALVGDPDIMRLGGIEEERTGERKLFLISTTHGAESSGLAAMIATLDAFKQHDMINHNWQLGKKLKTSLQKIIDDNKLSKFLRLTGDPCLFALETLGHDGQLDLVMRTYWMETMIANGVCSQGLFMPTTSHDESVVATTLKAFSAAAITYKEGLESNDGLKLTGPAIKPVFRAHI